jgi:TRAP-type C4-dicarboxylate transport system substrate-binding protein
MALLLAAAMPLATSMAAVAADPPITLHLGVSDEAGRPSQAAIDAFIEEVATRSGGSITIDPVYDAGATSPEGFEVGTAGRVMRGEVDLALVASRAWDRHGVTALQALQAPFLITDDALAIAVATSPIADDLLSGLGSAGVTGLALWPEDLRHPFSFVPDQPILAPEDLEGRVIRVLSSGVTEQLVAALGASVYEGDDVAADILTDRLHAAESGLLQGQSLVGSPVATGDVIFYPKYQVLVADREVLEALSDDQVAILRSAALATRDAAIASRPSEADAGAAWCASGGTVVLAGPEGIAAFQAAAEPVFAALAEDPRTAAAIERIQELAATTPPTARAVACEAVLTTPAPVESVRGLTGSALPPAGSWRVVATKEQLLAGGATPEFAAQEAGETTLTFDGDRFSVDINGAGATNERHRCSGTMEVVGDVVRTTTTSPNGPAGCEWDFEFTWRVDGESLYLVVTGTANPTYTAEDVRNNQAWNDLPYVRID